MRKLIPLVLALLIAACGEEEWRTKDISGLMPGLEFELTGSDGDTLTEAAFEDDVTLVFFGYTYCPDVCPMTLARLTAALDRLPADAADDVRVLFVSVDPERDDPKRLAEYTGAFGEGITGATGSEEQLRTMARRYRTTFGYSEPDEHGDYLVSHSSAVFVFDAEGEVRLMFRPDDEIDVMAADLEQLAG